MSLLSPAYGDCIGIGLPYAYDGEGLKTPNGLGLKLAYSSSCFAFLDFTKGVPIGYIHQRLSNAMKWNSEGLLEYNPHQLLENANWSDNGSGVPSGWSNVIDAGGKTYEDKGEYFEATITADGNRTGLKNFALPAEAGAQYTVGMEIISSVHTSGNTAILTADNTSGTDGVITHDDWVAAGGVRMWVVVGVEMGGADTAFNLGIGPGVGGVATGTVVCNRPFYIKGLVPEITALNTPVKLDGPPLGEWIGTDDGDEPRFTARTSAYWYNAALGLWLNEGYWTEESRTNLCLQSENLGTSPWLLLSTVHTPNDAIAPDGNLTADKLDDTSGVATRVVQQSVTVSDSSNPVASSMFIKKTSGNSHFAQYRFLVTGGTPVDGRMIINTDTGAISAVAGTLGDFDVEDCGNYWRVWIRQDNNATGNVTATTLIYPAANADGTSTLDPATTGANHFWGSQIEDGAQSPSSYVPTVLSAVVRDADSMLKGISGVLLDEINFAQGEIVTTFLPSPGSLGDGVTRYIVDIVSDALASDLPKLRLYNHSATAADVIAENRLAVGLKQWVPTTANVAGARHAADMSWDFSGGLSSFDSITGDTEPAFTPESGYDKIGVGGNAFGGETYNGFIKDVLIRKVNVAQVDANRNTTL